MRALEVLAQAFSGSEVYVRRPPLVSTGSEIGLRRGELGTIGAVQLASDARSNELGAFVIKCDFAEIWIRLRTENRYARAALRALSQATINLPIEDHDPTMRREVFTTTGEGAPARVLSGD